MQLALPLLIRRVCSNAIFMSFRPIYESKTYKTDSDRVWSQFELCTIVREALSGIIGTSPDAIDLHVRLGDQGVQSSELVRLVARLSTQLGRPLPETLPWRHPTVHALAQYLASLQAPSASAERPVTGRNDREGEPGEPIAIVGIGCRFPGAASVQRFWELLLEGTDAVRPTPASRWDVARWFDEDPTAPGKAATRWGGFLDEVDRFDPDFFGISHREARHMDPQQRLFLEVAWEALEGGGIIPRSLRGTATGVFVGSMWRDWDHVVGPDPTRIEQHTGTGHDSGIIASRLSYLLGARGPSMVVNTACSSSLVAVHLAVQSLRRRECEMAIVGATNLMLTPHSSVVMTKFGGMARDGRCKAYDARADGYVRGEGVGAVVLEPLSQALRRGANIVALIAGTAVNNDGYSNGLTAPSGEAQEEVLRRAWEAADLAPTEVDYVEGHGPGTKLGDPIEAESLGAVFGRGRDPRHPLLLGSVKTNLGHLEAAAGMAGLIKAALAIERGVIPATLHFEQPNPRIDFEGWRLRVPTEATPWPARASRRLAGVSAFGFGGTNAHVALSSAPGSSLRRPPVPPVDTEPVSHVAFVFSAHGSQWPGMAQALLHAEPAFRIAVEECDEALRPRLGWSVLSRLCSRSFADDADVVQPLLFTVQVAQCRALAARGVIPDAVIGQSMGEVAAAHVAGHLSLSDAAAVITERSALATRLCGQGAMAVVELGADELTRLPEGVSIAGRASPLRTVVAGERPAVQAACDEWRRRGVECAMVRVSYASHSRHVEPALAGLGAALQDLTPQPGHVPWWSTALGDWVDPGAADADYWRANLRRPFDLLPGLAELDRGRTAFIEIAPHTLLQGSIRESLGAQSKALVLGCGRRDEDGRAALDQLLATLRAHGLQPRPAEQSAVFVPITAKTPAGVAQSAAKLEQWLADDRSASLGDIAWTQLCHRTHHAHRSFVVVRDRRELSAALARVAEGGASTEPTRRHSVAFVFPGQGSQWLGMGRALWRSEPAFAAALRACDAALRPETGWSVIDRLLHDDGLASAADVVQPTLWAVMVALAEVWRSWGVQPDVVVGHSQGEIAAACISGALSLVDGARVVVRRSRLLTALSGRGGMAAVGLPPDTLARELPLHLSLAVANGPDGAVVSGATETLEAYVAELQARDVFVRRVDVDYAAHSAHVDELRGALLEALAELEPRTGALPIVSTVIDAELDGQQLDAAYWADNLREPVRFDRALARLLARGVRAFVEVSPHPLLGSSIRSALEDAGVGGVVVPSLRRDQGERSEMLGNLGRLFVAGVEIDGSRVNPRGRIAPVPTATFQRHRLWPKPVDVAPRSGPTSLADGRWVHEVSADPRREPWLAEHRLFGEPIVPAAAVLMWMADAVRAMDPGSGPCDVVFEAPIVASPGRTVQVIVTGAPERPGITVYASNAEGWTRHASAAVRRLADSGAGPTASELPGARQDGAAEHTSRYDVWRTNGLDYGDAFRRLVADRGQATGTIERFGDDGRLHPCELDAALQLTLGDGPVRVPFAVSSVRLSPGVPAPGLLRAGARDGDVVIWDLEGRVVAELTGVELRRPTAVAERDAAAPAALTLDWQPRTLSESKPRGRYFVVDRGIGALGDALAERLVAAGADALRIDPHSLSQALSSGAAHVVTLWGPSPSEDARSAHGIVSEALVEIQTVLERGAAALTWVLVGDEDGLVPPSAASLHGVAAVLGREHPELRSRTIDVGLAEPMGSLADAILSTDDEPRMALVGGSVRVARLVPATAGRAPAARPGTVLITGGTGFVGTVVARRMLQSELATAVVLVARHEPRAEVRKALAEFGDAVRFVTCDASDRASLAAVLDDVEDLSAVVHAAMVLDDAPLATASADQVQRVLAPKVDAALHLHELCKERSIDRFILLSSIASVLGNPGQGVYAGANAYLEGLVARRRAAGLPGQTQAWGLWTNQAEAMEDRDRARYAAAGLQTLSPQSGAAGFEAAWAVDAAGLVLVDADWPAFCRAVDRKVPMLARLLPAGFELADGPRSSEGNDLRALVVSEVVRVLGRAPGASVDPTAGFAELGMDSLMAVELSRALGRRLEHPLRATVALNYPTIDRLVGHLEDLLGDPASPATAVTAEPVEVGEVGEVDEVDDHAVAVVGMACRFPGADSPAALWTMLCQGTDAVAPIPTSRFDLDPWFDPDPEVPGKTYARSAGLVDDVDAFDAAFFGISPREAQTMDPQQGLLLEVSVDALQDAGEPLETIENSSTGVFVGVLNDDHAASLRSRLDAGWVDGFTASGTRGSVLSGRLSHILGVHGPSLTVNTACSSGLVAIHIAARSLRAGECDRAIAGGVNVLLSPISLVERSKSRMLSPTERCRPFSDEADGIAIGEGCGVVVLKRLADAIADGDRIRAVIRGSAVNHDGRTSGLTVPSGPAQRALIRASVRDAGIDPSEVAFVEAHGTGTKLGDPIEVEALAAELRDRDESPLWVGSVKANVGHLESAAGVAGFIKSVLVLEHREIPPQLHYRRANPHIAWDEIPLRVPTTRTPLQGSVAGVSSFGFSGTNVHVTLQAAPTSSRLAVAEASPRAEPASDHGLLVLSARDATALRHNAERWAQWLLETTPAVQDVCHTALRHRSTHPWRVAVTGRDVSELAAGLRSATPTRTRSGARVGWVFPGQGGVWPAMGRGLIAGSDAARRAIEEVDAVLRAHGGPSAMAALDQSELTRLDDAQPALFALQVGIVAWLREHGVPCDAVIGHSVGEVTAAWVSGALSLDAACRLLVRRTRAQSELHGVGGMLAVATSESETAELLDDGVSVAAVNGPRATILSGPLQALETVKHRLTERDCFASWVTRDYLAHCPAVDGPAARLRSALGTVECRPERIPMYSTVDGARRVGEALDAQYWHDNLRNTVRFESAVRAAAVDGVEVFVEVGPHPVLQVPLAQTLGDDGAAVGTLRRGGDARLDLLETAAALHVHGVSIDLGTLVPRAARIDVPGYAWQRHKHRLPEPPARAAGVAEAPPPGWAQLVRLDQPRPAWEALPTRVEPLRAVALVPLLLALVPGWIGPLSLEPTPTAVRRIQITRTGNEVELFDGSDQWRSLARTTVDDEATLTSPRVPTSSTAEHAIDVEQALGIVAGDVRGVTRDGPRWTLHVAEVSVTRALELAEAVASVTRSAAHELVGWKRMRGVGGRVGQLHVSPHEIVALDPRGELAMLLVDALWQPRLADRPVSHAPAEPTAMPVLRRELEGLPAAARVDAIAGWIEAHVRRELRLESTQGVPHDQGFFSMGMDSVIAVGVVNALALALGLKLPATAVFQNPTVAALSRYACGRLEADLAAGEGEVEVVPPTSGATARADLEALMKLSEAELIGRLQAKVGGDR